MSDGMVSKSLREREDTEAARARRRVLMRGACIFAVCEIVGLEVFVCLFKICLIGYTAWV